MYLLLRHTHPRMSTPALLRGEYHVASMMVILQDTLHHLKVIGGVSRYAMIATIPSNGMLLVAVMSTRTSRSVLITS